MPRLPNMSAEDHHHRSPSTSDCAVVSPSSSTDDFSSLRPPLRPPQSPTTSGSKPTSNSLISTLSYFTHPVSYTFSGIARRLSEDDAPTPLAKALSANWNGSVMDAVYHPPPQRKLSPFQPPPLTPLTLIGYHDTTPTKTRLLSKSVAEEIRLLLPPRLQLVDAWRLTYSLEQNGSTLSTLYTLCDAHRGTRGGFVLVVKDSQGGVFGSYLTDPPRPGQHYYGSGECFLWRAIRSMDLMSLLPPPPSEDTTFAQRVTTVGVSRQASSASLRVPNGSSGAGGVGERIRFKAFPFTGENDFSIFCQAEYLSVGGGDGRYGLWLDAGLRKGVSDTCPTFGNEPLSEEGTKFDVLGVEVWYVGSGS